MARRAWYAYILTNARRTVLYVGVTNDLVRRVWQHRQELHGFTARYHVTRLVWYEIYADPVRAITREKQLKAGSRAKKIALVQGMNPGWRDLWEELGMP
jgi:putative endonuclease